MVRRQGNSLRSSTVNRAPPGTVLAADEHR
jgi:hypothetical protein